jgi:formate hydrogenlyase subunit 6/NADH:ubiquinone oxidoreductase subunit I
MDGGYVFQEIIMDEINKVIVNEAWCKGCEICVKVCPKDVFIMENFVAKAIRMEDCTACLLCEQLCPDFAIVIEAAKKEKKKASA